MFGIVVVKKPNGSRPCFQASKSVKKFCTLKSKTAFIVRWGGGRQFFSASPLLKLHLMGLICLAQGEHAAQVLDQEGITVPQDPDQLLVNLFLQHLLVVRGLRELLFTANA